MTRKEKEKILLDGLGLKVGDRIEFLNNTNETFTIKENEEYYYLKNSSNKINDSPLETLIFCDYEKIEPKRKLGDIKCMDITCIYCPLRIVECTANHDNTLYEILDYSFNKHNTSKDSNIYKALKEELNKEVNNG